MMSRPVTLFTGQWADLSFEEICELAGDMGYDGLEVASWGEHFDLEKGANDPGYIEDRQDILEDNDLEVWAIGTHIIGQCVGARHDSRLDNFAPEKYSGDPSKIRDWAIEQMKYAPQAAANMGCEVITG
ncbi:TIM barrel protein, partial [Candidatus Bipolaricaulota bacterium]|nr:TIM barrel protein [Candidatus Bipolaricaulota bacterium]